MATLLTFRKYELRKDMDDAAALLRNNGIDLHKEEGVAVLDSNIIGVQYESPFRIKLNPADFDKATKILLDNTHINLAEVPEDYMLHSFSNEELLEVVAKPEEWGDYNYKLAIELLKGRDVNITPESVQQMKQQRFEQLATAKKYDSTWLFLAYISTIAGLVVTITLLNSYALLNFIVWPGLIGLIVGYGLLTHKTTLPNGERIFTYDTASRRHGLPLIALVCLNFLLTLIVLLTIQH